MSDEEDILYLYLLYRIYKRQKRRRRFWVKPSNRERERNGIMQIYPRLVNDAEEFYVYTKMTPDIFEELCTLVSPEIRKMDTNFREAIPPRERLLMTLRFLSSGESFRSLSYQFSIGTSTIRKIVYEVCEAIWKRCVAGELPQLKEDDFRGIGADFQSRWNFPNCAGCVVGKKIRIAASPSSMESSDKNGSKTYKRSIVLQGVIDARGNFLAVDVGDFDSDGDCGSSIFRTTPFGKGIVRGKVALPDPELVEGGNDPLPYVFIAPPKYPMLCHVLRPYPKRDLNFFSKRQLFNDRIASVYKKCSELAFGSLVDKWGILKSVLNMGIPQVCKTVRACCILHNFVRRRAFSASLGSGMSCAEDPENMIDVLPPAGTTGSSGRSCIKSMEVRNKFADFFYQTRPPNSLANVTDGANEPLLELECQADETEPMEDEVCNEEHEDSFQDQEYSVENAMEEYSGVNSMEDKKPEVGSDLDHKRPEHDFHFELETEIKSEVVPVMWSADSETGLQDTTEMPCPVLQCSPKDVKPLALVEANFETPEVKQEIL